MCGNSLSGMQKTVMGHYLKQQMYQGGIREKYGFLFCFAKYIFGRDGSGGVYSTTGSITDESCLSGFGQWCKQTALWAGERKLTLRTDSFKVLTEFQWKIPRARSSIISIIVHGLNMKIQITAVIRTSFFLELDYLSDSE